MRGCPRGGSPLTAGCSLATPPDRRGNVAGGNRASPPGISGWVPAKTSLLQKGSKAEQQQHSVGLLGAEEPLGADAGCEPGSQPYTEPGSQPHT